MVQRFLITGCARSGTGYSATLLTALGIPCGHERIFNPKTLHGGGELVWSDQSPGETSWLAAPLIANLPTDIPVLHQVREPVAFVRSKVRTRFFEIPTWYKSYAERVFPELLDGTPEERAMRYWVRWNTLVEELADRDGRTYLRYRLEDIDADHLRRVFAIVGFECTDEHLEQVLARHPRDYNTRGKKDHDGELRWDTLPAGPARDEVEELAIRYGYGAPTWAGTLST